MSTVQCILPAVAIAAIVWATCFAAADIPPGGSRPAIRIEANGFGGASEADIRSVVNSAIGELWRWFPDDKLEPIVIQRGHGGPITLYQRNDRGEIVVRLDVDGTYWAQFSYQVAHEFCHVLCGFREGPNPNKWFEETLCETASLYAMRAMAHSWVKSPPYPNWAGFHDALRDYADDVMTKRELVLEIDRLGLPAFYKLHRAELEANATSRELNGAMAIVLLGLLERDPAQWESVRWLNATPAAANESLQDYLQRWLDAAPKSRRLFVRAVANLFGLKLSHAGD